MPEVRRDVLLAVLTGLRIDVLEEVLHRSDDGLADTLHDAGVPKCERRRRDPGDDHDHHRCSEQPEPDPAAVGPSGVDVVEVNQQPRRTRKCSERAVWMLKTLLMRLNRADSAGDMPSPVISASGAAMNTVTK